MALLLVAQLLQPQRTDLASDPGHSIQATLDPASNVGQVLVRACGECHSNTASSRWYTRVIPFSFIIARAATDGRKAVNFAEWTAYSAEQQRELLSASCRDATAGTMPIPAYLRFRPEARLDARDIATICALSQ